MKEEIEKNENQGKNGRDEIFSVTVRAGKRTYFFDVKSTRKNEYYLTITESKKRFGKEGKPFYEKHKIFLYREDFDGFMNGLSKVLEYVRNEQPELKEEKGEQKAKEATAVAEEESAIPAKESIAEDFTNVEFEDLGENKE
ncbi:MAG TPA: DUF3276 family protein [Bacteroidetes bacterium]|nr:DUF3276 family protein [Bacteroidota bacterium]